MEYTRVNTVKLQATVNKAVELLEQAAVLLEKHLELCTDAERKQLVKPPADFPPAGRKLAIAVKPHSEIVAATNFDADAVIEDLDNVEILSALEMPLKRIDQLRADSRLAWLAEAYSPSLQVYGVARVRNDIPEVQQAIRPLAAVFATRRTRRQKAKPTE